MSNKINLAGVIGNPISHTKSPIMHNYWLNKYGVKGFYIPIEVKENDFKDVLKNLYKMGFKGVNITIPYKVKAFEIVDKLSQSAINCGAVNAVTINEDGSLFGDNTDGYGFIENIKEKYKDFNFKGKRACVLGAGGASMAVVASLIDNGCKVDIVNRTVEKAKAIADHLKNDTEAYSWDNINEALLNADILVNCTSLGMVNKDPLIIDLSYIKHDALVTDIVYNPLETELLKQAKAKGLKTVDGIGMLIHQARPAFKSWFNVDVEVTNELKEMMLK
ncbi:MAG: Shikimate dehydrogenase [Alphaproteobacteria bacterium ADurb.Bin438]|nr:MAG: Shikimate dehydrogenase [Alphaproteobacteria bacterium ADurb.Bin438]